MKTSEEEDNYALCMHLYNEHGVKDELQFNEAYELYILEVTQPRTIDVREHMWIHRLQSVSPLGLNLASTFGMPLLS